MRAARRRVTILAIGGLALAAPPAGAAGLSAKAADQIAALQKVKMSLTAPERKLDSRLALAVRQSRGRGLPSGVSTLKPGVTVHPVRRHGGRPARRRGEQRPPRPSAGGGRHGPPRVQGRR
jgi:hypothetical protein